MKLLFTHLILTAVAALALAAAQQPNPAQVLLEAAKKKEVVDGDLKAAIKQYGDIAARYGKSDRAVAATALVRVAECHAKLGDSESRKIYERVVREFADQKEAVATARARLAVRIRPAGSERDVVVRQIWAGPEVDTWSQPSPDGRFLALTDPRTRVIAVRDLTMGQTRLTRERGNNPVFSPDGKQIAFNRVSVDLTGTKPPDYSVYIVGVDGSNPRVLIQQRESRNLFPRAWSPDGKRIVVFFGNRGDGTGQIALVSSADGSVTALKTSGWRYPEIGGFSPDGRHLVYSVTKTATEPGGIYALATDGSRETALVEGPGENFSPVYTPDGNRVVFLSDRSGTLDLWLIRVAGGRALGPPELLRASVGAIHNLSFVRDGTFFYGQRSLQSDSYVADFDLATLRVTSRPRVISDQFVGTNGGATWSADGKSVAFLRPAFGESRRVVIRSAATGDERALPTESDRNPYDRPLVWFPDNRNLLVPRAANNRLILFKTDTQTGKSDPVVGIQPNPAAALSPDGKILYYSTRIVDGNILRLIRKELESGGEKILFQAVSPSVAFFGIALSPDGGRVAFQFSPAGSKSTLMVVPVDGGEPKAVYKRVAEDSVKQASLHHSWTPDGRHIVLVREVAGAVRLWTIPVEGGEPRLLEGPFDSDAENLSNISFLPDGRGITFTATRTRREMWAIRNLLQDMKN